MVINLCLNKVSFGQFVLDEPCYQIETSYMYRDSFFLMLSMLGKHSSADSQCNNTMLQMSRYNVNVARIQQQ